MIPAASSGLGQAVPPVWHEVRRASACWAQKALLYSHREAALRNASFTSSYPASSAEDRLA